VPTHTTRVCVCTYPQAIGAVAYTALRDLGVLMKTQYGRTDVASPARRHGRAMGQQQRPGAQVCRGLLCHPRRPCRTVCTAGPPGMA
jgi:hypothetical protein